MFDIISVGSATLDAFIKSSELQVLKTDKVFTGRAIIAPYGAKCEVDQLIIQSGGGGTNTAVGFSRLGLRAAVIARSGFDFASEIVFSELKKEGVDHSLLSRVRGDKTDYSTILIGPDGGRSILVYRGGTRIEEKLINWEKIRTKWLYAASLEGNLSLLKKLAQFAHQNGIKIAVNPGRKELSQKEALKPLLGKVDVVILNREEAARLTGLTIADEKIFPAVADLVKELAVVTDGARGVTLYTQKEERLDSHGFKIEMTDSTGAGDAFGCGFVAGLVMGWDLEKALKLGVSNGASVVTKIGAKTGLLLKKEIEQWLQKPLRMGWKSKK